ncbi:amidohydrolase family protein [Longimicrobium sp.]|jgi:imidazolonepropionase-like amidohydrolase|uniref:amidohydrolase family protein n=1 Tax=Longimicrobium sp. TaxID=2029185 RepID=UPI002EDB3E32
MMKRWNRPLLASALALTALAAAPLHAQTVEQGEFVLLKYQQPVGTEAYNVRRDSAGGWVTTARAALSFLGLDAPLDAVMHMDGEGAPVFYRAAGRTSTLTSTEVEVAVSGGQATVRRGGSSEQVAVPPRAFIASPYAPATVAQAAFRHWVAQSRPAEIPLLPEGRLRFQARGVDTVSVTGRTWILDRFSAEGLAWGRQSLWFDREGKLVALVHADAELDRFEVVRKGFESALPRFVASAVRDGVADLQQTARSIRPVREGSYALTGGTLVDGTGSPPVRDAVVIVRDGRIAAAGPAGQVRVPAGVPRVDVTGKTIIPGLWDTHVHYTQGEWLAAALASGVTTARDGANEIEWITAVRDAVRDGRALGPRMVLAGVIDGGEHPLGVITASTPEEARAAVRRYHAAGFPQIKIYESLPPALVPVIADEAHRLGMKVTGHVPTGMTTADFVRAGVDGVNHLNFIISAMRTPAREGRPASFDTRSAEAQAAIQLFRERGIAVEPTLARSEQRSRPLDSAYVAYEPGTARAPMELREALNTVGAPAQVGPRAIASLRRVSSVVVELHRAGIPVLLGSDLVVPGHTIHRELELAVQAGLTPLEAIRAATEGAARAFGMEREAGTVQAGKRADLVVLGGDPLQDIIAIRRVDLVITGGRAFEPADLWRAAGFAP